MRGRRASALVFAAAAFMAAAIPLLFAYRMAGHRLAAGARALGALLFG